MFESPFKVDFGIYLDPKILYLGTLNSESVIPRTLESRTPEPRDPQP